MGPKQRNKDNSPNMTDLQTKNKNKILNSKDKKAFFKSRSFN